MAQPFDRKQLRILPLKDRQSKSEIHKIEISPTAQPVSFSGNLDELEHIANVIIEARKNKHPVILVYGAHLIKNGMGAVLRAMMNQGWITHLATNGAGTIHDWELSFQGKTEEDVRRYVSEGQFGLWYETGTYLNLAILLGSVEDLGYGHSIGRMVAQHGLTFPSWETIQEKIQSWQNPPPNETIHYTAWMNLYEQMKALQISPGHLEIQHAYPTHSVAGLAYQLGIPLTVHPGFGYDIIYGHPYNSGAAIGMAAEQDWLQFVATLQNLNGGVYLSVGSAVMSPMIFEKALAMVRNIAHQKQEDIQDFCVVVNDIQEGHWAWGTNTEPTKKDPAYYLRFCKSFDRMNAREMHYIQADNREFLHNLYATLLQKNAHS